MKSKLNRLAVSVLLLVMSIYTMPARTDVPATTTTSGLRSQSTPQVTNEGRKKATIVRKVKVATVSAALIEKIRALEIARAMVTIHRRTVRPRVGVSIYSLSNRGFLVIKGGSTATPKAVEGDIYLNPDGSWTFKGCLCLGRDGDDCTIRDAGSKTCNQEEDCCGWVEITVSA